VCRKLRQVVRRCMSGRLHLRGFTTTLDSSGRMHRLRSLRTRMSSRCNCLRRQGSPDPRSVGSTRVFLLYIAEPRCSPRESARRVADRTFGNRSPARLRAWPSKSRKWRHISMKCYEWTFRHRDSCDMRNANRCAAPHTRREFARCDIAGHFISVPIDL
jgi:hypothetical protein